MPCSPRSVSSRWHVVNRRTWLLATVACLAMVGCEGDGARDGSGDPQDERPAAYRFVDVGEESGIVMDHRRSWGGTWIDHEGDGDPDLLANRHFFPPFYFDNEDGAYEQGALQDALNVTDFDRHGCIWGDPNADALLDVVCTQGAERGEGIGPNQLLVQDPTGAFTDQAARFGIDYPPGRSRSVNWVDYDNDDDFDLFVGAEYRPGYPNQMFRNDGGGRFEIADVGLDDELKTEAAAWADWDRDRDLDLIVTVKKGRTLAYENNEGTFEKVRLPGVTDADWLGVTFGEYDADRWPDLHLVSETRSIVLRNRRGTFETVHRMPASQGRTGLWLDIDNDTDQDLFVIQGAPGEGDDPDAIDAPDVLLIREPEGFRQIPMRVSGVPTGNGDSAATADHDRDGDLDLFVTNGYKRSAGPFLVLENESTTQNWVALDVMTGPPGDPMAMWSEIKVTLGEGETFWRQVTDGFVFRSQSEVGYLHLGIGEATTARVELRWWNGDRDCLTLEAGTTTELEHGSSAC